MHFAVLTESGACCFAQFFAMKNLQDAGIDHVFLWINPVEKWTRSVPRCYHVRQQKKI
jgi:hypothetical protein